MSLGEGAKYAHAVPLRDKMEIHRDEWERPLVFEESGAKFVCEHFSAEIELLYLGELSGFLCNNLPKDLRNARLN